jgi:putative ABC transport system substrate-binding protein
MTTRRQVVFGAALAAFCLGNIEGAARQIARIGDRFLKGAKPADIPVEQIGEFELTISSEVARALGVKIPESVLARATRIVQ